MSPRVEHRSEPRVNSQHGVALLIVVSLLTVVGIMGASFAFSMFLETQASRQFVSTTQARYVAEAGINAAWVLLDEDRAASLVDDQTEDWANRPQGGEADVDHDGVAEARWWAVHDGDEQAIGRFGLSVTDETGKVNLNVGRAHPSAEMPAIDLAVLLEQAKIARAAEVAEAIEQFRYGGPSSAPGEDGVDDDQDGTIDETDEYDPAALRGNDRRLEALEDVVRIAGLRAQDVTALARVATVYSWEPNISMGGTARVNVNTATADELVSVLMVAGIEDPWQGAVNIADYVDPDLELSRTTRASWRMLLADQGPLGSWSWSLEDLANGAYRSGPPDGAPLTWTATVPPGDYTIRAVGLEGLCVGDVTIEGQSVAAVHHLQSLGRLSLGGAIHVSVMNREPADSSCAFRGLEFVPVDPDVAGVLVRGIEAVRINELMVEPAVTLEVITAQFERQGSDWVCAPGESVCMNSGIGQGQWTWTNPLVPPGRYYVRVFAGSPGQTVGEVRVDGQTARLVHGEPHPATLVVGTDGEISVFIGKTDAEQTYFVQSVMLTLQPDAEYMELINLGEVPIDVSGWTLTGSLTGGRDAQLPQGSVIAPHGLLMAAVDLNDQQEGLAANGISARSAWDLLSDAPAVELFFPTGGPSADDDWLKSQVPPGDVPRLVLRTAEGHVVDEVQYPLPLVGVSGFQSLEKGDPTVVIDANADGIDDGWHPSDITSEQPGFTPAAMNSNEGLRESPGAFDPPIVHDPATELAIRNRAITGVGELVGVPSGAPWTPLASQELASVVDQLTVDGYRLETAGAKLQGDGWEERRDGYEYSNSDPQRNAWSADQLGTWRWPNVPPGTYRLSLYSRASQVGEQVSVRCGALQWPATDGSSTDWSPPLSMDAQGRVVVGQVTIDPEATPPETLTVDVACLSASGVCHLTRVQLDPRFVRIGPVNVNTAPLEALRALPGMTDALASRLIAGRPYGDQDNQHRGIGDLLIGTVLGATEEEKLAVFRRLANWVTVRSQVFQVRSLGQVLQGERVRAMQRIQTVIERQ